MRNYSKTVNSKSTPQIQPLFARTDMVKNNAGGFVFKITAQEQLERFLLLGTENGSYYAGEQKLTEENARSVIDYIRLNGVKVVQTVVDFAVNKKAPKADPGLFVLALATTYGDEVTKLAAYDAIHKVTKTATQLFTFLANVQNLRGWSRGLRTGVSKFYTSRTVDQVAYQMVKYRNRSGFTHTDAIRLSHPKAPSALYNELFSYAVGKTKAEDVSVDLVKAFDVANASVGITNELLIELIEKYNLTWEMIPTEKLNEPVILTALLEKMPVNALVRNLNRFAYNDMTNGNTDTTKKIVAKLTNKEAIEKSGIHPVMIINSMLTYSSGRGVKGNKTWSVNQNVVDALGTAYELALKNVKSTGKDILIAVDVSGSMNSAVSGMTFSASQMGGVLALTLLKTEPNAEVILFDTQAYAPDFGRRNSVDEVLKKSRAGGGTDCALAFAYAMTYKKKYDSIIIITDNETWAGPAHGIQLLERYRKSINPDVKVVEVALVSNSYTTLPVDDKNVVRTVGFDSGVLDIINKYLE